MSVPPYRPGPFDWRHLDQQAASELWVELIHWVEWLRERYDFGRDIRPCWFQHSALVEELTAAMVAHRSSYQQTKDPYHHGPAAWHYQVLRPMMARMTAITDFEQCTQDACGFTPARVHTLTTIAEFVDTDVRRRSESPNAGFPTDLDSAASDAAVTLSMEEAITAIDTGLAVAEDPADDFSAFTIGDARYEYDDDAGQYVRAQ
ncbi:hypothetical protein ACFTWF_22620 [Rhodococcus sp. NPDC056960]|uniref:hypothetical protein n=1 Tax=Rhodococcus sp. NPDC056960 TaxID=3345982 RepID=UPI0036444B7D